MTHAIAEGKGFSQVPELQAYDYESTEAYNENIDDGHESTVAKAVSEEQDYVEAVDYEGTETTDALQDRLVMDDTATSVEGNKTDTTQAEDAPDKAELGLGDEVPSPANNDTSRTVERHVQALQDHGANNDRFPVTADNDESFEVRDTQTDDVEGQVSDIPANDANEVETDTMPEALEDGAINATAYDNADSVSATIKVDGQVVSQTSEKNAEEDYEYEHEHVADGVTEQYDHETVEESHTADIYELQYPAKPAEQPGEDCVDEEEANDHQDGSKYDAADKHQGTDHDEPVTQITAQDAQVNAGQAAEEFEQIDFSDDEDLDDVPTAVSGSPGQKRSWHEHAGIDAQESETDTKRTRSS